MTYQQITGMGMGMGMGVRTYVVLKYTAHVNSQPMYRVAPVCIVLQHYYSTRTVIYYTSSIFNAATIVYYY